jgi:hypothetical protein
LVSKKCWAIHIRVDFTKCNCWLLSVSRLIEIIPEPYNSVLVTTYRYLFWHTT